jgi:hypothetical protein
MGNFDPMESHVLENSYTEVEEFRTLEEDEGWIEWLRYEDGRAERLSPEFMAERRKAEEWCRNIANWYTNYFKMSSE